VTRLSFVMLRLRTPHNHSAALPGHFAGRIAFDNCHSQLCGDVGASTNREKYGNTVLRVYQQNRRDVVPVNPAGGEIEGLTAYADLASIPGTIDGVSIITPPKITE
jgi:CoA binding domain